MNESILPVTSGLLAMLSSVKNGITPFKQEIFLLEIVVAGTTHCKEIDSIELAIVPEKVLTMKREPTNEYDKFAIAIYCDQMRIGFVPSEMNMVCSRLMDAGKLFFCRVVSKEWKNKWLKIKANIYMLE
ncbi:MAG: HIRAN domain-containing protein [Prolixibacteraceae bacterium]